MTKITEGDHSWLSQDVWDSVPRYLHNHLLASAWALAKQARLAGHRQGVDEERERAAKVADEQTRLNAQARRDRADDTLAFEFEGLGNVIAAAIRSGES